MAVAWLGNPKKILQSNYSVFLNQILITKTELASSGNRTRAARVAGEHSTTEPTML